MEEKILQFDLAIDDDGFLDRQCPDERCRRYFKVQYSDWDASDAVTATCPFCGHRDEATEFNTVEQEEYLRQVGEAYAQERLQQLIGGPSSNLRSTRGMLKVDVSTKFTDIPVPITPDATESMRLQITCESCSSTYAVVGAGFFCPLCGENSARHSFHQAVAGIRSSVGVARKLDHIDLDQDELETVKRRMLEDQIENLVTGFQRLADSSYPNLPQFEHLARSPFQRLEDASDIWAKAGGSDFTDILDSGEWTELLVYYQKRHVIGHQDGFVDEAYLRKTGDTTLTQGMKLVISEANVLRMADLVVKLANGLIRDLPVDQVSTEAEVAAREVDLFPPQLPGTTKVDWQVYRTLCDTAVAKDHDNLWSEEVVPQLESLGLTEDDIIDSLEILEAKGLATLSHTKGSRIARHIRLTRKGLEFYYSHILHDYKEARLKLRDLLLEGHSTSHEIAESMGVPTLLVHTILQEYESRDLISLHWSGGISLAHVTSPARLRRLA